MRKLHKSHGFTLIELMIAVAIIAILAAIALPYYERQKTAALQTAVSLYLNGLADQATSHYAFYNHYPKLSDLGYTVAGLEGSGGSGGSGGSSSQGNGGSSNSSYFGYALPHGSIPPAPTPPTATPPHATPPPTPPPTAPPADSTPAPAENPVPTPPPNASTDDRVASAVSGTEVTAESMDIANAGYILHFIWFSMNLNPDGTYKDAIGVGNPIKGNNSHFVYHSSTWVSIIGLNIYSQNEKTEWKLDLGEIFGEF